MRDVVQELLHSIAGQSLVFDPPEGPASSVTSVTVIQAANDDDGAAELATTGTATIATGTTLTSVAGASQSDPTRLELAAVQPLGRPLMLVDADGEVEWVELVSLDGTVAHVRTPLLNDYAAGATIGSPRLSIGVSDAWAADRGKLSDEAATSAKYRVVWVYVVAGKTCRRATAFDLVRYSAAHHVTPLDVDMRFPGWLDRIPVDYRHEQGRPLIAQAYRALKMDLRADNKLARWLRDVDVVTELVICRANLMGVELAALHGNASPEQLVAARDIYGARYKQLIVEPHTPAAASAMGAEVPARRSPIFRR